MFHPTNQNPTQMNKPTNHVVVTNDQLDSDGSDASPGMKSNPGLNQVTDCHSLKSITQPTIRKVTDAQDGVMRNESDKGEPMSNGTPRQLYRDILMGGRDGHNSKGTTECAQAIGLK